MTIKEAAQCGKQYFAEMFEDDGIKNDEAYLLLLKMISSRKMPRGIKKVFKENLTKEGNKKALEFCAEWCELGLWGYLKKKGP